MWVENLRSLPESARYESDGHYSLRSLPHSMNGRLRKVLRHEHVGPKDAMIDWLRREPSASPRVWTAASAASSPRKKTVNWRSPAARPTAGPPGGKRSRAFSGEVDTGSPLENAQKQESRAPFRFNRNEMRSSVRPLSSQRPCGAVSAGACSAGPTSSSDCETGSATFLPGHRSARPARRRAAAAPTP